MEAEQETQCLLDFKEVVKDFRTNPFRRPMRALNSLTFKIFPGQVVGLVGPNGSGKTTTFRIAAGLLKPDRGGVQVMGEKPGSIKARRRTGYMPEGFGLPGTLTVREMLDFTGRIFALPNPERAKRIKELESLLSLSGYMDRRMGRLSKGMSKRAGLATALFTRPRLLLLDEPIEGLDPLGSAEVKKHIKALAKEGTGVLISSHILSDVEAICGRIIIIHEGRIVLQGDQEAILSVRDRMKVCFKSPIGPGLLDEVCRLIEDRGGQVLSAGHPREELEALFKRLLENPSPPEANP